MRLILYCFVIFVSISLSLGQSPYPYYGEYMWQYGPIQNWNTATFTNFLLENVYFNKRRSGLNEGLVTNVSITVALINLADMDEKMNDYQVSLNLVQSWYNPTWRFEGARPEPYIEFDAPAIHGTIWTPSTYFVNEVGSFKSDSFRWKKQSTIHRVTRPNYRLRVYPDGTVLFVQRLTLRLSCLLNFRYYPMDKQVCPMKISSFAHTKNEVVFHWSKDSVLFDTHNASLVEYEIVQIDTTSCKVHASDPSDEFTCIQADFHIRRKLGSYVLQFYVPSAFFVCLSWLSFWIDIEAVVARISFSIFLVVNMAGQMLFVLKRLPPVAYVKAIDIWMVTCLLFVSGSLIEYSYIKVHMRNTQVRGRRKLSSFFPRIPSSDEEESSEAEEADGGSSSSGGSIVLPSVTVPRPAESIELPSVTVPKPGKPTTTKRTTFAVSPEDTDSEGSDFDYALGKNHHPQPQRSTVATLRAKLRKLRFSRDTPTPESPRLQQPVKKLRKGATPWQRRVYRFRKKLRQLKTNKALMLDVISRFAFPLGFSLFNVFYWAIYLSHY